MLPGIAEINADIGVETLIGLAVLHAETDPLGRYLFAVQQKYRRQRRVEDDPHGVYLVDDDAVVGG